MRRKRFDSLLCATSLALPAILLTASGLLFWAHNFVSDNIRTQLVAQKIFFSEAGSPQLTEPAIEPYLTKYAGQQLTTGAQVHTYADHFIAVHLKVITGGKSYSELSTASRANPTDKMLQGKMDSAFRRGLLLNA